MSRSPDAEFPLVPPVPTRAGSALPLSEAEQLVDALNRIQESDGTPLEKTRQLLQDVRPLFGPDADLEFILQTDLKRKPGPLVVERVWAGPTFDRIEPRPHSVVQELIDSGVPLVDATVPPALRNLGQPVTFILGQETTEREWFEGFRDRFLVRYGWVDFLLSSWAAGVDRMVSLAVPQRVDDPPLGEDQKRLASLVVRAAAPFVLSELFEATDKGRKRHPRRLLQDRQLSDRQLDVLHLLLRGMSEKEVARALGVSTHTVHTHVKKLYSEFDVSSRGELLALFIDERVLEMTHEAA